VAALDPIAQGISSGVFTEVVAADAVDTAAVRVWAHDPGGSARCLRRDSSAGSWQVATNCDVTTSSANSNF